MEKENNFLFYFAVALLVVSLVVFGINVTKVTQVTGRATDTAIVNVTIQSTAEINFTTDFLDFGAGSVSAGKLIATINSTGGVAGGNWSAVSTGFTLENIGNVNVTLDLTAAKTAATFIGGTSPTYGWSIDDSAESACTASVTEGTYSEVGTDVEVCSVFGFLDAADKIDIDIQLGIPYDSNKGTLTDTITATATAI